MIVKSAHKCILCGTVNFLHINHHVLYSVLVEAVNADKCKAKPNCGIVPPLRNYQTSGMCQSVHRVCQTFVCESIWREVQVPVLSILN